MSVTIGIETVTKRFGEVTIIPRLSAAINNGEFFTLLGPSGCGKTTLLRMIAGFNTIEAGRILFGDQIINDVPAFKRNIGMVFQSYAIFPHLTVRRNIEYGLRIRKVPAEEMRKRVDEILDLVKMTEYQNRLPERLSGGQQQRVALARAIVIHPEVLLMDEPLSNLDAKLRIEMRAAIRDIQQTVGITTVYVTHDQEEALAISDRIAVMNRGEIQQIGAPRAIYARPYNAFVATFIGHSNLFHAKVAQNAQETKLVFPDGLEIKMDNLSDKAVDGLDVIVAIRPEEFILDSRGLSCKVTSSTFLGRSSNHVLRFDEDLVVEGQSSLEYTQESGHAAILIHPGDQLSLLPNAEKINVFTADGCQSLVKGVRQYDEV